MPRTAARARRLVCAHPLLCRAAHSLQAGHRSSCQARKYGRRGRGSGALPAGRAPGASVSEPPDACDEPAPRLPLPRPLGGPARSGRGHLPVPRQAAQLVSRRVAFNVAARVGRAAFPRRELPGRVLQGQRARLLCAFPALAGAGGRRRPADGRRRRFGGGRGDARGARACTARIRRAVQRVRGRARRVPRPRARRLLRRGPLRGRAGRAPVGALVPRSARVGQHPGGARARHRQVANG
mmetsp:Transcript_16858/g.51007  ORF Transcript_16858/g.51007 Transcript_16858/m.51007 type:complete len:239 (+) Transcript_16858:544-1260(+)